MTDPKSPAPSAGETPMKLNPYDLKAVHRKMFASGSTGAHPGDRAESQDLGASARSMQGGSSEPSGDEPAAGLPSHEIGWLIELHFGSAHVYWNGRAVRGWTSDHKNAVRFSRREDADRVLGCLLDGDPRCVVVEHGWCQSQPPERGEEPPSPEDGTVVCLRRFDPVLQQTVFAPLPPPTPLVSPGERPTPTLLTMTAERERELREENPSLLPELFREIEAQAALVQAKDSEIQRLNRYEQTHLANLDALRADVARLTEENTTLRQQHVRQALTVQQRQQSWHEMKAERDALTEELRQAKEQIEEIADGTYGIELAGIRAGLEDIKAGRIVCYSCEHSRERDAFKARADQLAQGVTAMRTWLNAHHRTAVLNADEQVGYTVALSAVRSKLNTLCPQETR